MMVNKGLTALCVNGETINPFKVNYSFGMFWLINFESLNSVQIHSLQSESLLSNQNN